MVELTPKEIKEKPKPIGWLYKVIVDKHLTGPLLDGQIVINGVMGTPVNHLYFTPTLPIPHIFVWWQTSVYAEAELTRAQEQIAELREERDLQAGALQADAAVIEDLRAQLQPHNRRGWVIAAEKASRERNEMREQRDKLAETANIISKLIDLYFSPWGGAKSAIWEELTNDAPFSPDWLLHHIKELLAHACK